MRRLLSSFTLLTFLSCSGGEPLPRFSSSQAKEESTVVGDTPIATPMPAATSNKPLKISQTASTIGVGQKATLTPSGGKAPYVFAVTEGSGKISSSGTFTAPLFPGLNVIEVQDANKSRGTATVNVVVPGSITPNDPRFSDQTALNNPQNFDIDGPGAWGLKSDCSNIPVGIMDTGMDPDHPDLAANLWINPGEIGGNLVDDDNSGKVDDLRGWNFFDDNADFKDLNLHGTHVAGIIGAVGNNSTGVAGVCWRASLVPLKFLDADGAGVTSDAVLAIHYAIKVGVKVLNASFGGDDFSQSMKDALDEAAGAGILFVTAAGNESNNNDTSPTYPASYTSSNVIAVAATNSSDQLAGFSNFGSSSVAIAAPGSNILSTFPSYVTDEMTGLGKTSQYEKISGTSMAAPFVVGAAALLWSFEPSLSMSQIRGRLLDRADVVPNLDGKVAGSKRLNVRKALLE